MYWTRNIATIWVKLCLWNSGVSTSVLIKYGHVSRTGGMEIAENEPKFPNLIKKYFFFFFCRRCSNNGHFLLSKNILSKVTYVMPSASKNQCTLSSFLVPSHSLSTFMIRVCRFGRISGVSAVVLPYCFRKLSVERK